MLWDGKAQAASDNKGLGKEGEGEGAETGESWEWGMQGQGARKTTRDMPPAPSPPPAITFPEVALGEGIQDNLPYLDSILVKL